MRVATEDEARALYDLHNSIVDLFNRTELDHQMMMSVLLKITASLALYQEWNQEQLWQALAYAYEHEKFSTPSTKERH